MANHKHKTKNRLVRWAIFILACIIIFALCSRMGLDDVRRDPFRGVENVFE